MGGCTSAPIEGAKGSIPDTSAKPVKIGTAHDSIRQPPSPPPPRGAYTPLSSMLLPSPFNDSKNDVINVFQTAPPTPDLNSKDRIVNSSGLMLSDLVTYLQETRFKDQLENRFKPLCDILKSTFRVPRVGITLLCRHPKTRVLSCLRIAGLPEEVGQYFALEASPAETLFKNSMRDCLYVQDATLSAYQTHFVTINQKVRFCAAAPLWSSAGTFVGCFTATDSSPREMSEAEAMMMRGLADVIMRDIEHFYFMARAEDAARVTQGLGGKVTTGSELSYNSNLREGVLVIDRNWKTIFGNVTWEGLSGYSQAETEGVSFWNFFKESLGVSGNSLGFLTPETPPFILEGFLRCRTGLLSPCKAKFVNTQKDRHAEEAQAAHIAMTADKKFNVKLVDGEERALLLATRSSTNISPIPISLESMATSPTSNWGAGADTVRLTWTVTLTLDVPDEAIQKKINLVSEGLRVGDVTLRCRIGQGGYGTVFLGERDGKKGAVAVKLTQRGRFSVPTTEAQGPDYLATSYQVLRKATESSDSGPAAAAPLKPDEVRAVTGFKDPFMEALLSISLVHPNLVRSYEYIMTKNNNESKVLKIIDQLSRDTPAPDTQNLPAAPSDSNGGDEGDKDPVTGADPTRFVWLIQEYCDQGTLDRASLNGMFSKRRSETLALTISVLWDIVQGLRHLHKRNLIHADLTGKNVLFMSAPADKPVHGKPFVAKVADFGLSKLVNNSQHSNGLGLGGSSLNTAVVTRTVGTILFMPPELLIECMMSSRTDSYSFGALMYLMLTGLRPFSGLQESQILMRFVQPCDQLFDFPEGFDADPDLLKLARDCLSCKADLRPSSRQIAERIQAMWVAKGFAASIGPLQPSA